MNNSLKIFLKSYIQAIGNEGFEFIAIVDTSGSIDQSRMDRVLAEIKQIGLTFQIPILVIYVDYTYQGCQLIEVGESVELFPVGGGGTNYKPGFAYIEDQHFRPDIVLYFTDGLCAHFPEKPNYTVVWVQTSEEYFNPPFGSQVQMSNN
jgi:predicted metal-dependent peptidase